MDFVNIISSVGFPIVAFFYLVTRFEKTLENNTLALEKLKDAVLILKIENKKEYNN